ncbi:MAG: (2E,6E)-farnesyl diphosphate synthase [Gammaproteobacteria bacterium]
MPGNHAFKPRLAQYQQRVDAALDKCLPKNDPPEHNLAEAIRYSVLGGGGKRLRPAMVYAAGEAVGIKDGHLDAPACAVEMIHAYSLIHDDLPAMDDDDLRRGRPTCHRAFDEATAILAGDALQALAYEILTDAHCTQMPVDIRVAMLRLLTQASGAHGMAGGQAVDLASVGIELNLDQLEAMHRLKTGALIRASILLGAMCNPHTSAAQLDMLDKYACCIGLSYQIVDDILDVIGDTETLGKPQGSDMAQRKPTYPSILGIEASKQRALEQHQQALAHIESMGDGAQGLRELSAYIVERNF